MELRSEAAAQEKQPGAVRLRAQAGSRLCLTRLRLKRIVKAIIAPPLGNHSHEVAAAVRVLQFGHTPPCYANRQEIGRAHV